MVSGYQLSYGTIGKSHALSAVKRVDDPPLPCELLDRATSLLLQRDDNEDEDDRERRRQYRSLMECSIQSELETVVKLRRNLEKGLMDVQDVWTVPLRWSKRVIGRW